MDIYPNNNFILLLRQLLTLPLAAAYFPELTLHQGTIHRVTDRGLVQLETAEAVVDEREVIQAAKFVHWSLRDPAHRDLQVAFTIAQQKKKMAQYAQRYRLNGVVDTVCLVVADIRHQGWARSSHIIEALGSQDAVGNLLQLSENGFRSTSGHCMRPWRLEWQMARLAGADMMPL